jgi:hypothetical protein
MSLFRRRSTPAGPLPLLPPRLDGSTWPDPSEAARSFEASTYHELGGRRAFEPDAHDLAEQLVDAALPRLDTGAAPEDEPFLRKVFLAAARIGVGIGLVEGAMTAADPQSMDRAIAGALWQARKGLPAMQEDWARTGAWFLLAGHYAARTGPSAVASLVTLMEDGADPQDP